MSEVKTQEEIQQEVRNLEAQLEHYKQVDPANVDKHNELANQISELKYSIEQIQEREVHTQEVNETNSEIAIAVFDALIPDTKVFESMMGLTEFSDWRSGFYQLFDGALADRTQLMIDKREYDLAQKDEKIRLLSGQGLELQRQLDEARNDLSDYVSKYERDRDIFAQKEAQFATERDELNAVVEQRQEYVTKFMQTYGELETANAKIAELESKLEAAQKPKEEAKASQSFTDRMSAIKSKNEARIKSAAELALENGTPFRGKISLPEIKQPVLPFQGEDGSNPSADAGNYESMDTGNATVEGPQFPNSVKAPDMPQSVGGMGTGSEGGVQTERSTGEVLEEKGTDGEAPVTRAEFEKRLAVFREEFKYELMQHYRVAVTQ